MPAESTEAVTEPHEEEGTEEETPKKTKSAETDPPRKHHKSRKDKSWSRHSPTEKSPASSSHEHNVTIDTDKLGDVVAQALPLCCEDVKDGGKSSQFQNK